jgi:hypothetical protein
MKQTSVTLEPATIRQGKLIIENEIRESEVNNKIPRFKNFSQLIRHLCSEKFEKINKNG